ncbi:hypothetical protein KP509_03G014800 [Ceratopteris richardii]|uniref:DUF3856 domain-containing protein n=1 Tax=Ceratopteris richardii TaxID=49495 RepID=A0A8T2V4W4_CERRI|nr:hypothetical protein KP509_03G014800 [Ceratopteris richardii]KAH7440875.1 hypothetical protein KP509_03G014800 [Ceratopteris richardii]
MPLLSPNHNYAADECIAQIPEHHIPTQEEKVRASEAFDKSVLMAAHMAALHDAYIMEMAFHAVEEVTIKPSSPTSTIGGLKPSTLKQLKIGKVHRRRVVQGTLCSKALCTKSHNGPMVVNVFEDEEGNAIHIYLANAMEGNCDSVQAQRFYPQDSKVAVKEPYLTRMPDGEIVLLVEKMTDLVFLWVPEFTADEGLKDSSLCADVREVFAMEKTEDNPDNVGACDVSEDTGGDETVLVPSASRELRFEDNDGFVKMKKSDADAGNGGAYDVAEDIDTNEAVPVLSASRELKFEDNANGKLEAKGEEEKNCEVSPDLSMSYTLPAGKSEQESKGLREDCKAQDDKAAQEEYAVLSNDGDDVKIQKVQDDKSVNEECPSPTKDGDDCKIQTKEEATFYQMSGDITNTEMMPSCKQGDVEDTIEQSKGSNEVDMLDDKSTGGNREYENANAETGKKIGNADPDESAASLRIKGNALFSRGEFEKAVHLYTRATEKARSCNLRKEEIVCLSNRAEVWLRLNRFQEALNDAEAALRMLREVADSESEGWADLALAKALFRKGRALMGLHKYEDAMRALQEVLGMARAPADGHLKEAALKCRDRLERALKPSKRRRAAMNRKKASANFMLQ